MKKIKLLIIPAAVIILAGAAYYIKGSGNTSADVFSNVASVSTAAAKEGTVYVTVESIALAESWNTRSYRSSTGGTIAFIAGEGDKIRTGELLILFETEDLDRQAALADISLKEALLNRDRADAAYEKAKKTLSDREILFASGAVSRDQLDQAGDAAETALFVLKSADLSVEKSRISLQTAQKNRDDAYIKAPFDGTVLKTHFSAGDWAGQNSLLLSYGDISRIRFKGEVDEYDIGRIKPGMAVTITADSMGKALLNAQIEGIAPQAEIVNNIAFFTVYAAAENKDELMKPGMSADMTILVAQSQGVLVPSRAVTTVRTRSYADVMTGEGSETRRVTIGADDGINAVVTDGIEAGEIVMLPASAGILPGTAAAAPAASANGASIIPMSLPGSGGSGGGGGGSR